MNKKVILVTGANRGIGLEVVRQLARQGHDVILTARDEAKGNSAQAALRNENLSVAFLQLDVSDQQSIQHAAEKIQQDFKKLDVLIHNAAVLLKADRSLGRDALSVLEETIRINAISPLEISKSFLKLMPAGARIIMTSSGGGSMTDPVGGWSPAYCVSKSMLNAITRHLAYELDERKISVNAYCPGWVRTDMGGRSAPRDVQRGADTAVWLATEEKIPTGKFFRDRKIIPW